MLYIIVIKHMLNAITSLYCKFGQPCFWLFVCNSHYLNQFALFFFNRRIANFDRTLWTPAVNV